MRTFVLDVSGIIAVKYILLYNTQEFHRDGSLNGALVVQTTAASGCTDRFLFLPSENQGKHNLRVEFRSQ